MDRPNVLWISTEDISPMLGCYGDACARTPRLDAFAAEGLRYTNAFTHAGVCAPVRSGIITGMYPSSIGSQHMRSQATLPDHIRCFTEYLRESGYYCANRRKEDYNFQPPASAWDDSSNAAHYRNRAPGQPFFAVVNLGITHESVLHRPFGKGFAPIDALPPEHRHDPAKARVPAYHPDTPEIRADWARYHDSVSAMDRQVGDLLDALEQDGLAEDTIVMFWGDHGTGMPRGKRWIYDSGTRIPLLVRVPKKYAHLAPAGPGAAVDEMVSAIDFAPTVLHLAGVSLPAHLQGRAFLGEGLTPPREHVFFIRDRMDSRYDLIRGVYDGRFRYLRNFNPHVTPNQRIPYLYKAAGMQSWAALHEAGKLSGPPAAYMAPHKPVEELYDVTADPDDVNNLAAAPEHQERLVSLRETLYQWMRETGDLGLLDESEMHRRRHGGPEFALGQSRKGYDLPRILEVANLHRQGAAAVLALCKALDDGDSAVRYWAAVGLMAAPVRDDAVWDLLQARLTDDNVSVRLAAAEALLRGGRPDHALSVVIDAAGSKEAYVRLRAANVLDLCKAPGGAVFDVITELANDPERYVREVAECTLARLSG